MDKKMFLAVSLCAAIFLVWNQLYLKPYNERQQAWYKQQELARQQQVAKETPPETGAKKAVPMGKPSAKITGPELITLGDKAYSVVISTKGGAVTDVDMSDYRGQKTDKVHTFISGPAQLELSSPSPEWAYISSVVYSVQKKDASNLVLSYDDANISIQRSYALNAGIYSVDQDTTIKFKKQAPNYVFIGLETIKTLPKSQMENERRQIVFNRSGGQKTWQVADIDELKEDLGQGNWMGFTSRYFINALANKSVETHPQFQAKPLDTGDVEAALFYKVAGSSLSMPVRMYYGPKDIDMLKQAGYHLESAVDFGWFTVFAYPMLEALKWFYKYLHNFGLAIILLTVLVKLLTYPLTLKSMRSMKQMQRIQPQMQRLRERYKDDKEKLNRETLQLMRANGYNPMSGCLPMFIQMPIFIALYNVLYGAIDLYGQPFFGWIHDLSAKDPFYVTPILLAVMMFVQQRMTPNTAADPAQQRMMMVMPVVFGFMMLWLPAGLTLYMLVNSVVSIVQQVVINRSINVGASAAA